MRPELPFIFSLLVVALSIPPLITIAIRKRLFDMPTEDRKIHKRIVPNLGGLAIFSGFLLSISMFIDLSTLQLANYLLCGGIVIFVTGLKDDIIGVDPLKKFIAQFIAAFIVTMLGEIRIMDLGGFMGIHHLSYPFSIGLSVIAVVGIVNAFNLIDGIDGLAGSLGLVLSLIYAWLFYHAGETDWLYICMALGGSLVGFLIHNFSPAKIFMGDSGSLMLGYIAAILSIQFINTATYKFVDLGFTLVTSAPALAMAIIILPLFDTLRVFAIRLANNQSPFKADRNHLHHRMLSLGLSHMMATLVLVLITGLFLGTALVFQPIGSNQLVGILIIMIILLNTALSIYIYSRKRYVIEQEISDEPGNLAQDEPPIHKMNKSKMGQNEMMKKISKN